MATNAVDVPHTPSDYIHTKELRRRYPPAFHSPSSSGVARSAGPLPSLKNNLPPFPPPSANPLQSRFDDLAKPRKNYTLRTAMLPRCWWTAGRHAHCPEQVSVLCDLTEVLEGFWNAPRSYPPSIPVLLPCALLLALKPPPRRNVLCLVKAHNMIVSRLPKTTATSTQKIQKARPVCNMRLCYLLQFCRDFLRTLVQVHH